MPTTKAQQRATSKYVKSHYDEIKFRVKKGEKERIKAYADENNVSVNSFVSKAVFDTIKYGSHQDKDNKKSQEIIGNDIKLLTEPINLREIFADKLIKLEYLCTHGYSDIEIYREVGTSRLFCKPYKGSWKEYIDGKYVELPYGTVLDCNGKLHLLM